MKSIAVIPARGGSKRIPRKNIRILDGKPLIAYPIIAALESGLFDHVIVSTDDPEIAKIAEIFGASAPFVREGKLSDDFTPTVPVIADAIRKLSEVNIKAELVCCIYPTSIFVKPKDLIKSQELLRNNLHKNDFIISISKFSYPIQRALTLLDNNSISFLYPEYLGYRSQDLPERFHDAAQFYWGKSDAWEKNVSVFHRALGFRLNSSTIVDIDDEEDLQKAERIILASKI